MKRPSSGNHEPRKRLRAESPEVSESEKAQNDAKAAMGLKMAIHPLLFDKDLSTDNSRDPAQNPYLDPHSRSKPSRTRRLVFNTQGKFVARAEALRREEEAQARQRQVEREWKIDVAAGELQYRPEAPPEVEWWDKELQDESNWDDVVTEYVQHPVPLKPLWDTGGDGDVALKMHRTKKEAKRLRKNTRAALYKEKQDRIRLGLDPPPPPKLKLSNVMNIFPEETVKNPTEMEQRAKAAVAERRKVHEDTNEQRKLSAEQRYEKWVAKIERDKAKGLQGAVFRIEKLSDGRHQFMVNYNARHSLLTGVVLVHPKFALVVAEGSALEIKHYCKQLLKRVTWTESAKPKPGDNESQPPEDLSNNKCRLVWTGALKKARFHQWSMIDIESEQDGIDILSRHGCEGYWIEARALD